MAYLLSRHFVIRWVMSTQKSWFDNLLFSLQTLKKGNEENWKWYGAGDDTQVKKRKFCPKWLEVFHWLKYDSTEKRMKCNVCLDRCVSMAVNLNRRKILCMEQTVSSAQV